MGCPLLSFLASASCAAPLLAAMVPVAAPAQASGLQAPGQAERPPSLAALLNDDRIVEPEALRQQAAQEPARLRVIVNLRPTPPMAAFAAWRDRRQADAHRASVARRIASTLRALPETQFRLRHALENQPAFAGEVTPAGLALLLALPEVESIESDDVLEMHTDQGITLMNADAVRAQFDGSGVGIAVVDTGIQYGHAALGGGGFPNGKVIGGYDFGDNDADPLDQNGHGTAAAGVAAGDVIVNGNYVGGVAPGARLYALKIVSGGASTALDSTSAAAWDWCVTHQDDDPGNPILVLNHSFGGGLYSAVCNAGRPSMATAASNVAAAGITAFCSAGNEGSCDSIAAPACVDHTIAVGAVYDANLGSLGWCVAPSSCVASSSGGCASGWACQETTSADQVTCYSNSAAILDILAPADNARAPALGGGYANFGGTSAASPYAAGAAAILIHAARSAGLPLSPTDIRTYFTSTGTPRFDPKSGLTKPRVDLGEAVGALGTWVDFAYSGPESGSPDQPYNTLVEGIAAAPAGTSLFLRTGATAETPSFPKAVTLRPVGGPVRIGS